MKAILFILLTCTVSLSYAQSDKGIIKEKAEFVAEAMLSNNVGAVIDYIHPKILELSGGRDMLIGQLNSAYYNMVNQGVEFESVEIGEPLRVYSTNEELFCLVPQTIYMKVPGGKLKNVSSLLAVSPDNGEKWYFIDTAQLTTQNVRQILPNFNMEMTLPPKSKPLFIPD